MKFDWDSFGIEKNSPVDHQTITLIQKQLGVILPENYIDLLKYANEAAPEISSFHFGTGQETCVSEFFAATETSEPQSVLWYSKPHKIEGLPLQSVPIARDAGGYIIYLNFQRQPASIELIDPNSRSIFHIANSFDEFITLWQE